MPCLGQEGKNVQAIVVLQLDNVRSKLSLRLAVPTKQVLSEKLHERSVPETE